MAPETVTCPCCRQPLNAKEERDELDYSFHLRWRCDLRAIERWQQAHPDRDHVWPDHTDLLVWLLEQLDALKEGVP